MVETDTGFFIYTINNVYYVTNPYDSYKLNSTSAELSEPVFRMAPLSDGRIAVLTKTQFK